MTNCNNQWIFWSAKLTVFEMKFFKFQLKFSFMLWMLNAWCIQCLASSFDYTTTPPIVNNNSFKILMNSLYVSYYSKYLRTIDRMALIRKIVRMFVIVQWIRQFVDLIMKLLFNYSHQPLRKTWILNERKIRKSKTKKGKKTNSNTKT